jgi:hypothetical protein
MNAYTVVGPTNRHPRRLRSLASAAALGEVAVDLPEEPERRGHSGCLGWRVREEMVERGT